MTKLFTNNRGVVITPEVLPKDWPAELFTLCMTASNREPKSKAIDSNNWDVIKNPYEGQTEAQLWVPESDM